MIPLKSYIANKLMVRVVFYIIYLTNIDNEKNHYYSLLSKIEVHSIYCVLKMIVKLNSILDYINFNDKISLNLEYGNIHFGFN